MTLEQLLQRLEAVGVALSVEQGRLVAVAPTGTLSADLQASIRSHREALLEYLRDEMHAPKLTKTGTRTAPPVLSFAQQRLWFLDQLDASSALYNVPIVTRLRGSLDTQALRWSLHAIVRRHEALRTTFPVDAEGVPHQAIAEEATLDLPLVDLTTMQAAERESEMQRRVAADAATPFDLARGPLLRAALLRLSPLEHVLSLTLHHIVCDEWSTAVMAQELSAFYSARLTGAPANLPALPVQYADFAQWQRRVLSGRAHARELAYWKGKLSGSNPLLSLPTDRPYPSVRAHRGATLLFEAPASIAAGIRKLSEFARTTAFVTLATAVSVLLAKYSRQEDICIGTPIANRGHVDLEPLIGFFLNTVVLRISVSPNARFSELLQRMRETALEAYAHQALPFEQVVEALGRSSSGSHSPIFQVLLTHQAQSSQAPPLLGLEAEPVALPNSTAKFDLSFHFRECGENLSGAIEYDTDLFDPPTIDRLLGHLWTLFAAAIAQPDARLRELALLHPHELSTLRRWNATEMRASGTGIARRFEQQVARTPDAAAVTYEERTLTYSELNARSNRLAHLLRARGVGPDVVVAICVQRSIDAIVAVLGVLKCGGAYLPLDATYPAARLEFMLRESGTRWVLTQRAYDDAFAQGGFETIGLDDDALLEGFPSGNIDAPVHPEQLAYVMYTSGSSGRPKGVAMRIGALDNLLDWQLAQPELRGIAPGRILQFASLGFDVSFQEIFTALCGGHCLVLPSDAVRKDAEAMKAFIDAGDFVRVHIPNAVLQAFARMQPAHDEQDAGRAIGACEIVTAGEPLAITDGLIRLARRWGGRYLYNQYGPTETHVVTQMRLACDELSLTHAAPPIGQPIGNTKTYILDADLQPVPLGVVGDLYLAGSCLARGYFKQPVLTAERFLPDPFAAGGARMYRSGDLARYLQDGNIQYVARSDTQIKIRGFRVELGEVESAIAALPTIAQAAVVVHEDAADRWLVAYVVANGAIDEHGWRQGIRQQLPEFMLPRHWIVVDGIPTTNNGKVDRARLAATAYDLPARQSAPLQTETERALAPIWAEVLKCSAVARDDDFFECGGHSLLATQLVSRLRVAFRGDLALRAIFEHPRLHQLAAHIDQERGRSEREAATARERLRARIDAMSEAEIAALLREKKARLLEK